MPSDRGGEDGVGKRVMYCGNCGGIVRDEGAGRPEAPQAGCDACRPPAAGPAPKHRSFVASRSARLTGDEDVLKGILLNAALVTVGAVLLVVVTPGEATPTDPGRLDAALWNIQRIRQSDPSFLRADEVLSLYDAAASVAGQKRPEVNRLREEYCRQRESRKLAHE